MVIKVTDTVTKVSKEIDTVQAMMVFDLSAYNLLQLDAGLTLGDNRFQFTAITGLGF